MTIRVSTQEMQNQIDSFGSAISTLRTVLKTLSTIFSALTTVSWMSPAAMALAAKIRLKLANFEKMIRALEAQVTMLTNALNAIRQVEDLANDKVAALRTTAFTN